MSTPRGRRAKGVRGIRIPGGTIFGGWLSSQVYEVGDVVTRSDVLYRCILAHTNQQPPNATYWTALLTAGGGAPTTAEYLVGASDATLTAERVVTDTISITWDLGTAGQAKAKRAALTGDVTAAADSNATVIPNDTVTYAKMQNVSATDKVLGRSSAGAGDVEEIACTAAGRALIDDADTAAQRITLGLGTLATKSTVATADIDNDAVTYAKLQNVSATDRLLGRSSAGAGDAEEIICTAAGRALIDDADAAAQRTTLGLGALATKNTAGTADVDDAAITFAKQANLANQRVIGRNTAGSGVPEAVTLSQLLDWIGTTAKGDLLARGASTWARLPVGSDGQLLQADSTTSMGLAWVSFAFALLTANWETWDLGVADINADPTVAVGGVIS